MLLKRFLNARREKKLVLTQLILPLLMVCLTLLLIKTLQESMQNEPPRILNLSNLSIKGVPNIGFYADFRPSVDPNKKNALFDVSWRFLRSLIERFRFKDDDDYEYEIWLKVFAHSQNIDSQESFILPFFTRKVSTVTFSEGGYTLSRSQSDKTSNI